jgi:hypothetical protein
VIDQRIYADAMLRGDGENIADSKRIEAVRQIFARPGIRLVHGQRDGLAQTQQHAREIAVGRGDFGAAVHQENYMGRIFQSDARLLQDLAGDVLGIVHHDTAGIDQLEAPPTVIGQAMEAVAGDAGLVAHDGAALPRNAVKEGRFSDIWAAHDDHRGDGVGHVIFMIAAGSGRRRPAKGSESR